MGLFAQRCQRLGIVHLDVPQYLLGLMLRGIAIGSAPTARPVDERTAQGVMVHDQRLQGGPQYGRLQRLVRAQDHRLVPVVTLRDLIGKKGLLDR